MKKSFLKSKTFWVNFLMMLALVLPEVLKLESFTIPKDIMGLIIFIVNVALRFMTKGPVGLTSESE